jgi:hypothetical protein
MDVVLDLDSERLNTCIVPTGNSNKRQGGELEGAYASVPGKC